MASYKVVLKPSVEKDLRGLPGQVVPRVWRVFEKLTGNPFPTGSVKLSGAEHLRRLRVGDYRIVYGVEAESRVVTVHYVRHRREVYR